MPKVRIFSDFGHYVAFVNGKFYCSGDTFAEVKSEIIADFGENYTIEY